ncbi:uracil-DNA glycosylase [Amaricoccus sp.]|uniref:uracil-DNA glycosylase n=1 Tax=Amaricoccus sp. TaxID=1872485 RepID=UPI0025BC4725|nr:uracil-DNA glycosylase [Amaricoccus sp.]
MTAPPVTNSPATDNRASGGPPTDSPVPPAWRAALAPQADALAAVAARVAAARAAGVAVAPAAADVFRALELTPPEAVRAVILGQDPYPTPGHADGLCFSVRPGVAPPRSLRNVFRELAADLGLPEPQGGSLEPWARQGVLLLNTVLTVEEGAAAAHAGWGWEAVTDAAIDAAAARPEPTVFLLWGRHAQAKAPRIPARHTVIATAHPSPLSARRGFLGSRPFSRANAALRAAGRDEIDWRLP